MVQNAKRKSGRQPAAIATDIQKRQCITDESATSPDPDDDDSTESRSLATSASLSLTTLNADSTKISSPQIMLTPSNADTLVERSSHDVTTTGNIQTPMAELIRMAQQQLQSQNVEVANGAPAMDSQENIIEHHDRAAAQAYFNAHPAQHLPSLTSISFQGMVLRAEEPEDVWVQRRKSYTPKTTVYVIDSTFNTSRDEVFQLCDLLDEEIAQIAQLRSRGRTPTVQPAVVSQTVCFAVWGTMADNIEIGRGTMVKFVMRRNYSMYQNQFQGSTNWGNVFIE